MCLPSKRFTDPSGFCGTETNVTTNKSKGKGLGFGVLGFFFFVGFFYPLFILLSRNDKIASQLGTQLFMAINQLTSLLLCHPK